MPLEQANRIVAVTSPLGGEVLVLKHLSGQEGLSQLFDYRVELLSEDDSIDFNELLGKALTLEFEAEDNENRYIHGHISHFSYSGYTDRYTTYHATLRPWLWFLTHRTNCRIFQNTNADDIFTKIFREHSFADFKLSLNRVSPIREYCVQYNETDFDFVNRLMEEEGIYYYFQHSNDKHTLIITDDISSHTTVGNVLYYPPGQHRRDEQHITEWHLDTQVRPGQYVSSSFDYTAPGKELESRNKNPASHDQSDKEVYQYPGNYTDINDGNLYARIRLEELQSITEVAEGKGNSSKIQTGRLFTLKGYPRQDQNSDYLITQTHIEIHSDNYITESLTIGNDVVPFFRCRFSAMKSTTPYRAPCITPRAKVSGPQTAIVVGPSNEEIHTDELGRVKVQFHWDREGTANEDSSCWIRVSQNWAGNRWGAMFLPRIGQEVIVDFLEGNPDRPIITGRVYNGDNSPPYSLPQDKTQSGIKSRSTDGQVENANEIRFEDMKGEEEVYLHAEKDFNRVVENNDTLKVGFEKADPGDQTIDIYNDRTVTIENGDDSLTVKAGNLSIKVNKGDFSVNVDSGKIAQEAAQSIQLTCGSSSLKLEPGKITLKAPQIELKADASIDADSPMTTVKGSGNLTLKGGTVLIN